MNWISVDHSLPHEFGAYLCTDGKDIEIMYYFGEYKGSGTWSHYLNTLDVTHWACLPALPSSEPN